MKRNVKIIKIKELLNGCSAYEPLNFISNEAMNNKKKNKESKIKLSKFFAQNESSEPYSRIYPLMMHYIQFHLDFVIPAILGISHDHEYVHN